MHSINPIQSDDHRAQSEVIGTVLLVAVVVIIASVIGIFAIDIYLQAGSEPTPEVRFDAEQYSDSDQQVRLYQMTGDRVSAKTI